MSSLHELIMGNAFKAFIENAQRETTNMQELALYSAKMAQTGEAEERQAQADQVRKMALYSYQKAQDAIAEQQMAEAENKQRLAMNEQAISSYDKFKNIGNTDSVKIGGLIPSLSIKDGKASFSLSTPSSSESKASFELSNEQNFIRDVQSGVSAEDLRVAYPGRSKDIDTLWRAGTVKSKAIPSSAVQQVPEGMVSKGVDEFGRPLGYAPKSAADIKAEQDMKVAEDQKKMSVDNLVASAQDTLNTISKIKSNMGEFGIRGVMYDPPGWKSRDWTNNLNKLKSQKIVDLMEQMKRVSKTGATGFGQLSEKELKVLETASTALEAGTPMEEAKVYLDNMEIAAKKIIAGSSKGAEQNIGGSKSFSNLWN